MTLLKAADANFGRFKLRLQSALRDETCTSTVPTDGKVLLPHSHPPLSKFDSPLDVLQGMAFKGP